jgi:integrase
MMKRNRRAGVEDRWNKTVCDEQGNTVTVPSARHGTGLRWLARFVDDAGKERSKAFGRKTDAQAWLDTITAGLVTGSYIPAELGAVTFGSFYADWSQRQIWAATTRRGMALACESVPFASVPFAELRPSHLEQWVKTMQDGGLAPGTIKTRYQNVRSVIRAAARDGLLARDPSAVVKLPRVRSAAAAMIIPTPAQVAALLSAADPGFQAFIALAAFAGLRSGEVSAVKVSDIDFLHRELKVSRQVQRLDGHAQEIRPPKYGSERVVYLPDALLGMLAEHIRCHAPGEDADRWLFGGEGDMPIHENRVFWLWKTTRKSAGVSLKFHSLRHYFASGLIAAGVDVVAVSKALGHHSPSVTLNTYSHLWPNAADRTRKALGELLAATVEPAADQLRTAES